MTGDDWHATPGKGITLPLSLLPHRCRAHNATPAAVEIGAYNHLRRTVHKGYPRVQEDGDGNSEALNHIATR